MDVKCCEKALGTLFMLTEKRRKVLLFHGIRK